MKTYGIKPEDYRYSAAGDPEQEDNIHFLLSKKREQTWWKSLLPCLEFKEEEESSCDEGDRREDGNNALVEMLIISHDSKKYMVFEVIVNILCLVTSYFYMFLAAFRKGELEDYESYWVLSILSESIFLISIASKCFLEFIPEGAGDRSRPERRWPLILENYARKELVWDLIPILPWQFLELRNNRERLFFVVKAMRASKGFQFLKVSQLMGRIREMNRERLDRLSEEDEEFANNRHEDLCRSEFILTMAFSLKIFESTIVVFNFTYMVGMLWLILCKIVEDLYFDAEFRDYGLEEAKEAFPDQFLIHFGLIEMEPGETVILIIYYTFTSLSTVGFGDLHPRGNLERLACAAMLMLGVAVFSAVMGIFIDILHKF